MEQCSDGEDPSNYEKSGYM